MNMNELQIFNNPEFGEIRTVEVDGEPWLVGKDVAQALGYKDTVNALKSHVDEEDKRGGWQITTPSGEQQMTIINESGLYSLVLSSKLPGAKKFRRWVTAEVLPNIRRTGSYSVKPMTEYQKMIVETRRYNVAVQKARLLNQIASEYDGTTYKQVLQAHATKELTGEFLLPLPKLEAKTYSAAEIGDMLGVTGQMVGILTNRHNLKTEEYGAWFNDKAKGHNKEVQCFRYYDAILPVLRSILAKSA